MAFGDFTLPRVIADFRLTLRSDPDLFGHIPPGPIDPAVTAMLDRQRGLALAINTEKARSELLIAPVLSEVWRLGAGRVALFSGVAFNADPAAELTGVCDYIIGRPPQVHFVTAPILMIMEAKNEDMTGGLGQCAAAMVGAQRFNARQNGDDGPVYGCVTDGGDWRFLRLRAADLDVDIREYPITDPARILGIILHFVGLAPAAPAAA